MVGLGLFYNFTKGRTERLGIDSTGCLHAHEQQFDVVKHAIMGPFFIIAKLATIMLPSIDVCDKG